MIDIKNYNEKGQLHGECKSYYNTGELHYEGQYKNDLRVGLWIYYWDDGKIWNKGYYENDKPIGFWNLESKIAFYL